MVGGYKTRGSKLALKRPRALPSQTERPVCDRRGPNRGSPHSWKLLHKLVNLEDPPPPPSPTTLLMMKWAEGKHDAHRHFFMRPTHTCTGGARAIGEPVLLFGDTGTATVRSGPGPAALELLFCIICLSFYLTRGAPAEDDLLSTTLKHWLQMCPYFFFCMIAAQAPETMSTEQFRSKASMILVWSGKWSNFLLSR